MRLKETVGKLIGEDWSKITDHRYRSDLLRDYNLFMRKAKKVGIPTENYQSQMEQKGFNV